jgi:hypothetical protein
VSVDYATVEGSARAGHDFVPTSGTLVFSKGECAKTVQVAIHDDDDYKEDMTFFVQLSNVRATIADGKVRSAFPSFCKENANIKWNKHRLCRRQSTAPWAP